MTVTKITPYAKNTLTTKNTASAVSTNFDNIKETGLYYITGDTMTNAPANYTWSILVVMNYGVVVQLVLTGAHMYSRKFAGSPETWGAWTTIK